MLGMIYIWKSSFGVF